MKRKKDWQRTVDLHTPLFTKIRSLTNFAEVYQVDFKSEDTKTAMERWVKCCPAN